MDILRDIKHMPKGCSLILGFFDGIHAGHRNVIKNTISEKKIVITFSKSPTEFFGKKFEYIYPREYNYKILENIGVDFVYEHNFADVVKINARDYIDFLIKTFEPISITTGFNYTFGTNKEGTPEFFQQKKYPFKYLCTEPKIINNEIVSSTKIKEFLKAGNIQKANLFLSEPFTIKSTVIKGEQLGRKIGFPTANMKYPEKIIKIPYGVYKIEIFNKPAIMNWGTKPTFLSDEILEVHIPNFNENLYGKELEIKILNKIRDEKKFENIEDLTAQIKKDVESCLEL